MKKEKGITLVSLIITIIILLVLAGITISQLTGENGLLKRATNGKENSEIAKKEEEITLMEYEALLNSDNVTIKDINYKESTNSIQNPDIGFYAYYGMNITDESSSINSNLEGILNAQDNLNQSLISFFVNLESTSGAINGTEDRRITDEELNKIDDALSIVRVHNKKVILRFRYIISSENKYKEPSMDMILTHIEQLGPIMEKNKDVINVVEAGFLGSSGEWYPTNYNDAESRRKVVFKLLDVLPKEIMVNVRTPGYYREIFNTQEPINETNKFSDNYASRVGLHNDGYLGSSTDLGTYGAGQRENELTWQNSHNAYTIFGGEASTDESDPSAAAYSDSANAIEDMKKTHCTYLNRNHNTAVLDKWKDSTYNGSNTEYKGQTTYKYIGDHLGYRYVLRESKIMSNTKQGEKIEIILKVENTGFANMVHEKKLELIIEKDGRYYKAESDVDVREWKSGTTSTVVLIYTLPSDIQTGEWNLYVRVSDKLNEEYCVQFANDGIWDTILKANYIGKTNIENGTNNNVKFAQISAKDLEGTNTIQTIESRIILDGKVSSRYEWINDDLLYSSDENNIKIYMRNDSENIYILVQDDRIANEDISNIRFIMRAKTEGYIEYGWWSISGNRNTRNPFNYVIVNTNDMQRLIDNSKGAKEKVDSSYYQIKKGENSLEYKISIDAIPGLANGVEIDYIGYDLSNASWVVPSEEYVVNLHEDYKYTVNL